MKWPLHEMCIRDRNKVTKKYEGLDGTELAISESQERMAVALAPEDEMCIRDRDYADSAAFDAALLEVLHSHQICLLYTSGSIEEAISQTMTLLDGAYSLVILSLIHI